MTYMEMEKVRTAEVVLREANFTLSRICCSRPSCFDFVARKNDNLLFIKIQPDIDNFSPTDSHELMNVSKCFSAASIVISEKSREKPLEDDTAYSRYDIFAVTLKTFEDIVLRQVYPLIQAGPGGYYVEIDGEAIKRRRQELGLSVGDIAEIVGISRRTVYGYERGMAKASVTTAYKLVWALGIPVAKSVDIFEKTKRRKKRFLSKARRVISGNKLLQKIFRKFVGYEITAVRRAPFDFVITVPNEKTRIVGGVTDEREQGLERRVDEILSVSRVAKAHPVLVTDGKKVIDKDIYCIGGEELLRVRTPEDLLANV
ncbi:MAG: helix-turn-helix domain-containing protein [Candidatus Bathyarchaeia archaeon]